MADNTLRTLENALKKDPDNQDLVRQLAMARSRTGKKDPTWWRIKHSNGKYLTTYNKRYDYKKGIAIQHIDYAPQGSKFKTEDEAKHFLQELIENGYSEEVKQCEMQEFRTIMVNTTEINIIDLQQELLNAKKIQLEQELKKLETAKLAEIANINKRIEQQKAKILKESGVPSKVPDTFGEGL